MIAADTSVVVAAFASWHEGHAAALRALEPECRLPAHVVVETYSVLTRLPPPHRAPAAIVADFLERRFPAAPLTLGAEACRRLIGEVAAAGIAGGGVYDALVAVTAREAGATLVSRDRRAQRVYDAMGVRYEMVTG